MWREGVGEGCEEGEGGENVEDVRNVEGVREREGRRKRGREKECEGGEGREHRCFLRNTKERLVVKEALIIVEVPLGGRRACGREGRFWLEGSA